MSKIIVFDTETIGLEKAFCYDIGYCVVDTESGEVIKAKEFIIEQLWSNKPLFETAYYADKKELYVSKMRGRKAQLVKWGTAVGQIIKDIEQFEIVGLYAYNSNFDTKVIDFNADWYKTRNFLDYAPTFDIWGYTSELITSGQAQDYVDFCENNNFISESGNIMNNADTWGKFLYNDLEWNEEHTALEDSKIETKILFYCFENGLQPQTEYKVCKCISSPNATEKQLVVVDTDGQEFEFHFKKKVEYKKNGWKIKLN